LKHIEKTLKIITRMFGGTSRLVEETRIFFIPALFQEGICIVEREHLEIMKLSCCLGSSLHYIVAGA